MRKLSLFSGIGGIDLAAHWAGMETVAFCEREPFPVKVLQKNFPGIPIYDDIRTLTKARLIEDGIIGDGRTIDIISGGYPCQPFSVAGKREGKEDDRHLWPEVKRLLEEIRPRWFVGENVAGHVTLGLDDVLSELGDIGYTAQPLVIPAAAVGAPQRRDRVFIVGYTEHYGSYGAEIGRGVDTSGDNDPQGTEQTCKFAGTGRRTDSQSMGNSTIEGFSEWRQTEWNESQQEAGTGLEPESERSGKNVADSTSIGQQRQREYFESGNTKTSGERETSKSVNVSFGEKRPAQPGLGRVLDGVSRRLDRHRWPAGQGAEQFEWEPPRVAVGVKNRVGRLKGLGNAVVPWQIYPIMAAIKAIDDQIK